MGYYFLRFPFKKFADNGRKQQGQLSNIIGIKTQPPKRSLVVKSNEIEQRA